MHNDDANYVKSCNVCQRTGKPSRQDEIPLVPQINLQEFNKWPMDFVGPNSPIGEHTRACYIITVTD